MEGKIIEIGNILKGKRWSSPMRGRVYSVKGIAPTVNCVNGGGQEAKILVKHERA